MSYQVGEKNLRLVIDAKSSLLFNNAKKNKGLVLFLLHFLNYFTHFLLIFQIKCRGYCL